MTFGDGLKPKSTTCKVCVFLASLPEEERLTAEALFADDDYSHAELADEMDRNGAPVTESSVGRHRQKHVKAKVSGVR